MRPSSLFTFVALSAVSLLGCIEDSSSGEGPPAAGGSAGSSNAGAGGSGSSGTSGQGGAGPAGSSGSSGQSGSAGSGSGKVCGGLLGDGTSPTCAADEFCDYPDNQCGAADNPGVCKKRPTECPVCAPENELCACDGQTYCTACEANMAGVDVSAFNCGAGGSGGAGGGGGSGGSGGSTLGQACGGLTEGGSPTCDADQFCDYPDNQCGAADGQGVCKQRPTECPVCAPENQLCACDGQTYCTACEANMAGFDLSAVSCGAGGNGGGSTIQCGTSVCSTQTHYCEVENSDVGTIPTSYTCKPLPSGCGNTPSCACLKGELCGQFSCKATGSGFTLVCPAG